MGCSVQLIPHRPLQAVHDLTRDGRLSTYNESVLKLSKISFRGKCAHMGHPLKLPSPTKLTKLARLGHFSPASQAWCSILYLFSGSVYEVLLQGGVGDQGNEVSSVCGHSITMSL
jgi:hypothetical protein